uniref:hypothetical protein n=1 Tax=Pararhizobium sp. IMCC3301 TaxID=3067904 RepID=UPI0027421715|nr:hypothetical protein [Pararhizobium sp. IMCC3301]
MDQLADHFRNKDRSLPDQGSQRHWFIKARQDQQKRSDIEGRMDDDILGLAAEVVMATQIQIDEFKVKLDTYDEATVIALMENQAALDLVNARLQALLDRAYVMEDGRRVFKTEDGAQVFDEHGLEISPDQLDFDLIEPSRPSWESYQPDFELRNNLDAERQGILDFQEKLDAARDKIADGEISANDLDDLDAELVDAMPPSVRAHVPGFDSASNAPEMKAAFRTEVVPAKPDGNSPAHGSQPHPAFDPMG